ncbi:MurT ligase domain-containing protein [Patescibacteria group bacterium]|nr:MurT ligase domain-containing protein [Patescibacteria group bacterium]
MLGKLINYLIRFLKIGGGSAAPGLYSLRIDPNLVENLAKQIPKNVIITGTNGKTTTAKMLSHFAKSTGLKVIRNHTGSNLERGIASTLIQDSSLHLRGVKLNYDLGIWELDEAAFNNLAPKLKPDLIVFLNVFRDQLDRYGEIDSVVKKWGQTLQKIPAETLVLINGDDINTVKLARDFRGKVKKFGVKDYKIMGEGTHHLKEKENLDFEARNVKLDGLKCSSFSLFINHQSLLINLPLPGLYHIYDALAALASASLLNLPVQQFTNTLKNYSPAFGRVEKLPFGYIFLIKNPAGATQVFETIAPNIKTKDTLLLALNDNLADGTDVSWIWDAKFEHLRPTDNEQRIICSGNRAYDLALRLKYAGIEPEMITCEPDLQSALNKAKTNLKGNLFVLPTYTAMLELQSILAKSGIKKNYWEEDA